MNENDPQLPEDIRKALKESPELTPPESFYQGVLEKIQSPTRRHPVTPTPWFWGYPAKGLATVCVLVVMVLVIREKMPNLNSPSSPAVSDGGSMNKPARMDSLPVTGGNDDNKSLSDTKEVQERLHDSISNLVGIPSPFEEVDEETKRDLDKRRKGIPADALKTALVNDKELAAAPISHSEKSALQFGVAGNAQARQTVNGAATQGSFINEHNALAKKQKEYMAMPQAAAIPEQLAAAASAASGARSALSYSNPPMAQEWKGVYSGIATFQTVVVRTQEDWQKLWLDHNGYIVPPPPPPDVDFMNFMVIGVFDGTKPSGGYAVQIVDVKTLYDKIEVSYVESGPTPGLAATQAISEPYHLQVVPKSLLPVSFEKINK
jgi:hypothetical protein